MDKIVNKQDTIEQLIEGSQATMILDAMLVPEALLVILIVYKLSTMESKLAEEVKKSGGEVLSKKQRFKSQNKDVNLKFGSA